MMRFHNSPAVDGYRINTQEFCSRRQHNRLLRAAQAEEDPVFHGFFGAHL